MSQSLLPFILFALVASISPGPTNLLILAHGAKVQCSGRRIVAGGEPQGMADGCGRGICSAVIAAVAIGAGVFADRPAVHGSLGGGGGG